MILEHLDRHQGEAYFKEIVRMLASQSFRLPWARLQRNDLLGKPKLHMFHDDSVGRLLISSTTLRYICLGLKALQWWKEKSGSTIQVTEIGGGYGGQCFMMFTLAPFLGMTIESYTIFDLPNANALQQRYLNSTISFDDFCFSTHSEGSKLIFTSPLQTEPLLSISQRKRIFFRNGLDACHFFGNEKENENTTSSCVLFSSYALGELSFQNQNRYFKLFNGFFHGGYVIWNNTEPPSKGFFSFQNKEKTSDRTKIIRNEPEVPQTYSWNRVYCW